MLVAAAVCPHPPLLIPQALGAAGAPGGGPGQDEQAGPGGPLAVLARVRAACFAAVAGLIEAGPDLIMVAGGADRTASYPAAAAGSLRDFGIAFGTGTGDPVLPLSLTVGAWLVRTSLGRHPAGRPPGLALQAVASDTPAAGCARLGQRLALAADRVALLAMGDASARKAAGVHGAPDPQAERYDAAVAAALAAADTAALAGLDPALDAELAVAGRAAWQVLAGAAAGGRASGRLRCAAAPFDVSYLVASWECPPGAALTH
ncbi:MAG TPA: hypothetical protein VH637_18885 [Streptosporangiaceae bacterium]